MNNKMFKNTILFIVSGIVILLLIGLIILNVTHIGRINDEIEYETITLQNNRKRLLELKKLSEAKDDLEKAHVFLKDQIPSEPEEYGIIEQLEKLALQSGANLEDIKFEDRVNNGDLYEMPLKLTFKGRYPSLFSLLESICAGKRLFRIDGIIISKIAQEDGDVRAEISARAFHK